MRKVLLFLMSFFCAFSFVFADITDKPNLPPMIPKEYEYFVRLGEKYGFKPVELTNHNVLLFKDINGTREFAIYPGPVTFYFNNKGPRITTVSYHEGTNPISLTHSIEVAIKKQATKLGLSVKELPNLSVCIYNIQGRSFCAVNSGYASINLYSNDLSSQWLIDEEVCHFVSQSSMTNPSLVPPYLHESLPAATCGVVRKDLSVIKGNVSSIIENLKSNPKNMYYYIDLLLVPQKAKDLFHKGISYAMADLFSEYFLATIGDAKDLLAFLNTMPSRDVIPEQFVKLLNKWSGSEFTTETFLADFQYFITNESTYAKTSFAQGLLPFTQNNEHLALPSGQSEIVGSKIIFPQYFFTLNSGEVIKLKGLSPVSTYELETLGGNLTGKLAGSKVFTYLKVGGKTVVVVATLITAGQIIYDVYEAPPGQKIETFAKSLITRGIIDPLEAISPIKLIHDLSYQKNIAESRKEAAQSQIKVLEDDFVKQQQVKFLQNVNKDSKSGKIDTTTRDQIIQDNFSRVGEDARKEYRETGVGTTSLINRLKERFGFPGVAQPVRQITPSEF